MTLTAILRDWRWPALAILSSAAMLAAAHGFERIGKMLPCELCLRQREVYWAAIAMAFTGLALWRWNPSRRFLVALCVLIGMVFVTGAIVAGYHAGVEWKWWAGPSGCSGNLAGVDLSQIDLSEALNKPMATVSCTEAPWHLFGLSMAGWNTLVSAGLAIASFIAARATWASGRAV